MSCEVRRFHDGTACFVCNTSDVAFGPIFRSLEEGAAFWKWLDYDPRSVKVELLASEIVVFRDDHAECPACGEQTEESGDPAARHMIRLKCGCEVLRSKWDDALHQ